ncbi:MAG: hypothetical protein O3A53_12840 [Acidobacteria bacterium]|nr:hypothetical protein [Acidobacteriota bacterium]MDA1235678.1 hypothetical protein [Acidobacteriota bacterium]
MLRHYLVGLAIVASASAQAPRFDASKVQVPNSSDTAPLLPGTLLSIYGEYLGPVEACQVDWQSTTLETPTAELLRMPYSVNTMAFPKELCGVRVLVDGEPTGLLYVQQDQINFKVPFATKLEGTVDLQVIHGDLASAAVAMPAGLESITLSVTQPAYTNMPIWVDLATRQRWFAPSAYGYDGGPNDFGCRVLQVRKDGRLLEPTTIPTLVGGVRDRPFGGPSDICWSIGPRYTRPGPLPLHLAYRLREPGEYEVRLVQTNTFHSWMVERKRLTEDD